MKFTLIRVSYFILIIVLFFSCTKIITTDIGSGLIPPVDGVITMDTVLDVITRNTGYDSVSVGLSDNNVFGYTNDPVFGETTASLNFQVAPPNSSFSWGFTKDHITLDSVVLCLSYQGAWGDSLQDLKLHVYSMDPEVLFSYDSAYKNTTTFLKGTELTEFNTAHNVVINKLDDVDTTDDVYAEVTTNQIRIRLNKSFGQQLIDLDSASAYVNDSTFYNHLRGLIVEPEKSGKALLRINLSDTSTHLSIYYRGNDTVKTTKRFSPNLSTSASANSVLRKYQGTEIPGYIASADTGHDIIFMQTSPGLYAKIKTPGIDTLKNRIIHRAELLMYQMPDADTAYFTPPNLFLSAYSDTANRVFTIPNDVTFYGTSISNLVQFGVYPKKHSDADIGVYYSFDISRYVQGILTKGEPVYDLLLSAPYNQYIYPSIDAIYAVPISSPALNTVATGRIRLGGGDRDDKYKMKLHIVYSLIN